MNKIFQSKQKIIKTTIITCLFFLFTATIIRRQFIIPTSQVAALESQLETKETLRFFALGDIGTGDEQQEAVANWMEIRCKEKKSIDGILLLGDNFYMKGVQSASDPLWTDVIERPYSKTCIGKAKIYPILGNHDYKGNPQAQIDYTAASSKWFMPYRFYALNFKDTLRIVAYDSFFPDFCFLSKTCATDFLYKQVKNSPTTWTLAIAHYPLSSASLKGTNYSGDTLYSRLQRYLVCNHLDGWISGHAHHLEHRKLETCSTELFISGGGGGPLEPIHENQAESKFSAVQHGFLEIEVSTHKMNFRFIGKDAKSLYETTLTKD